MANTSATPVAPSSAENDQLKQPDKVVNNSEEDNTASTSSVAPPQASVPSISPIQASAPVKSAAPIPSMVAPTKREEKRPSVPQAETTVRVDTKRLARVGREHLLQQRHWLCAYVQNTTPTKQKRRPLLA